MKQVKNVAVIENAGNIKLMKMKIHLRFESDQIAVC